MSAQANALAAGRVLMRGSVPDIASPLAAYDALVIPSIREGCPLVAVEAFAAGVPVVGCDVPGVRDVLATWEARCADRTCAQAARPGDAVSRLRDEPDSAAACIAASRSSVARFDPHVVASELLCAYRRAAAATMSPRTSRTGEHGEA